MKKVKVKNKSHYLVLICCLFLVLGIVIYFIINLIYQYHLFPSKLFSCKFHLFLSQVPFLYQYIPLK